MEPLAFELELDGAAWAEALGWAARALPPRPALPVLAGLLVEVPGEPGDGEPSGPPAVSCFDHEVAARAQLPAEAVLAARGAGRVLLPGRPLAEFARALRGGPVVLRVGHPEGGAAEAELVGGGARFALAALPLDEYPTAPPGPPPAGTVPGPELAEAVAQVARAAGRDDTVPALTGILLEADGATLTLSATDRYRFARRTLPWSPIGAAGPHTALIPARLLEGLARTFGGTEVELAFGAEDDGGGEGLLSLAYGARRLTTRLLTGRLPGFARLMPDPAEAATTVEADAAELAAAVRRVMLAADQQTPLRVRFHEDSVELGVSDAGSGVRGHERVAARRTGPALETAFTGEWLRDGIEGVAAERVLLHATTPTRPVLLTAPEPADYHYLLSPRRVS
ncbi:hypothetical protein BIV57_05490 [Mangrovactinospora gilvigrisea]|uniref:DNA polymerase III subunit beta n=1 Tax=Mangrovactinospora gilvigrisea TaxID=1428644 RepID=A0A1J7CFJ2_9ACTN|nr:DNA polymerase III subunit beta [Mangrovactinospora gilvigrisea]OIV38458.1 hypothetical protein BIV57_05490 [Mangrovactinospora gilvigrisea]